MFDGVGHTLLTAHVDKSKMLPGAMAFALSLPHILHALKRACCSFSEPSVWETLHGHQQMQDLASLSADVQGLCSLPVRTIKQVGREQTSCTAANFDIWLCNC